MLLDKKSSRLHLSRCYPSHKYQQTQSIVQKRYFFLYLTVPLTSPLSPVLSLEVFLDKTVSTSRMLCAG